jgi:phosphohistidine phosphatase
MRIYVFRHGIAEDAAPGQDDSTRALTPTGLEKLHKILRTARGAGVRPDMILTSPYARAVQTADVAKDVLDFSGDLIETEALVPYQNSVDLWQEILVHRADDELMVVGHNPLLSDFVCFLTGTPSYGIALKKGAIAMVDVPATSLRPQGSLMWLLTARLAGG